VRHRLSDFFRPNRSCPRRSLELIENQERTETRIVATKRLVQFARPYRAHPFFSSRSTPRCAMWKGRWYKMPDTSVRRLSRHATCLRVTNRVACSRRLIGRLRRFRVAPSRRLRLMLFTAGQPRASRSRRDTAAPPQFMVATEGECRRVAGILVGIYLPDRDSGLERAFSPQLRRCLSIRERLTH
jgi:hypothetical protein